MTFENLVFEGGGIKSLGYLGALRELSKTAPGTLQACHRFAGTSAGALFATLLASRFTMEELEVASNAVARDFSKLETSQCCLTKLWNAWRHLGMHSTSKLEAMVIKLLAPKFDARTTTLAEHFVLTGCELVIVAANTNRRTAVYFHHKSHPTIRVLDALVASMAVPAFFEPRAITIEGTRDLFGDGGLADNYPVWVFNDLEALYAGFPPGPETERLRDFVVPQTLGFKLLSKSEENTSLVYRGREEIDSFCSYATAALDVVTLQLERASISESYIAQTVGIDTRDISALQFSLSPAQRASLEEAGAAAVRGHHFAN